MKKTHRPFLLFLFILIVSGGQVPSDLAAARQFAAPVRTCSIVGEFPHDSGAFTQGLLYHGGFLYEGTGLNGSSSLRKVEIRTGRVLQRKELQQQYFGEGIAMLGKRIYQITWRSGVGFVYDLRSFKQVDSFSYETEGWGLTTDGRRLVMSDGSDTLMFVDPRNYSVVKKIKVRDGDRPVLLINELEFVKGRIYANILGSDYVACIAPESGNVKEWIDLRQLRMRFRSEKADALNGIAYDVKADRLFVTGKNWPVLFEIKINY